MFKELFNRKPKTGLENNPPAIWSEMAPKEDPVNYNSVLDYLTGLSDKDYKKMVGSADIYRKANKDVAKLVGVKDEPTVALMPPESPELSDQDLDDMLNTDPETLAFIDDAPEPEKPRKKQSTTKVVEVKEK